MQKSWRAHGSAAARARAQPPSPTRLPRNAKETGISGENPGFHRATGALAPAMGSATAHAIEEEEQKPKMARRSGSRRHRQSC